MESWSYGQDASLSAVTTTPQTDQIMISDQSRGAAKDLLGKVQSESARLAAQLAGMVQAKTLTRQRTGKRGLRIDGKRLHRMAIDDGRVFKQRSDSVTIDATVHISLDISASMGSRMELAREAVLSLVLALKQINGVTISASAYPGTQADRVYPIASAHDSGKTAAEILTTLNSHDTTPMATGLWHAVHQVLQARTERRLILMVTDGEPDIDHRKSVIDLVNRCGQSGIEVVGLGIQVHTVEQLFPKSLVIDRLAQLKASIFELTRAWLIA